MVEEVEDFIRSLLKAKLIVPNGNGKSPIASKFKINPWVRHMSVRQFLQFEDDERQHVAFYSQIMTLGVQNLVW